MAPDPNYTLLQGHVLDILRTMEPASVQCVVTSPPYWGLRDYSRCECATQPLKQDEFNRTAQGFNARWKGEDPPPPPTPQPDPSCPKCHGTGKDDSLNVVWGGEESCEHMWGEEQRGKRKDMKPPSESSSKGRVGTDERQGIGPPSGGIFCSLCHAWRGQLGLEPTTDLYVQHLVEVFREVRRVLRDDGTLWLNMGDCYAGSPVGSFNQGGFKDKSAQTGGRDLSGVATSGILDKLRGSDLKPKDLVGMPWRVAFALQADGWWLRSDIIWSKPNPMPESVTDRPTRAHEYVFLLTKAARYFYDANAVREENHESSLKRARSHLPNPEDNPDTTSKWGSRDFRAYPFLSRLNPAGRNRRTVWDIPTQPYPEAHFATFPEALVEPCIKAGTPERGSCGECGSPWERVVERGTTTFNIRIRDEKMGRLGEKSGLHGLKAKATEEEVEGYGEEVVGERRTVGFRPTCSHNPATPVPQVVLDPFAGSGTTGLVALKLGRRFVGIDIKQEYLDMAERRLRRFPVRLDQFEEVED